MSEGKVASKRKTKEERVEEIDKKIANYENKIEELKKKKDAILHPMTYSTVMEEAKKRKISPKKLAEMLNAQFPAESGASGE